VDAPLSGAKRIPTNAPAAIPASAPKKILPLDIDFDFNNYKKLKTLQTSISEIPADLYTPLNTGTLNFMEPSGCLKSDFLRVNCCDQIE
jgi:hypothetical protein